MRLCEYCGKPSPTGRWVCCGEPECKEAHIKSLRRRHAGRKRELEAMKRRARYEQLLAELRALEKTASDDELVDWLMQRTFLSR